MKNAGSAEHAGSDEIVGKINGRLKSPLLEMLQAKSAAGSNVDILAVVLGRYPAL